MKLPAWMRRAACLGADPEMFFEQARVEEAKAVCRHCPVEGDCYRYARLEGIDWGVWGGQTAAERCGRGRPKIVMQHGTYNGYRVHRYRDEEPCPPCRKAQQTYDAWRRRQDVENRPGRTA